MKLLLVITTLCLAILGANAQAPAPSFKQFRLGMPYQEVRDSLLTLQTTWEHARENIIIVRQLGTLALGSSRGFGDIDTNTEEIDVILRDTLSLGCAEASAHDRMQCFGAKKLDLTLREGKVTAIEISTTDMRDLVLPHFAKLAVTGISSKLGSPRKFVDPMSLNFERAPEYESHVLGSWATKLSGKSYVGEVKFYRLPLKYGEKWMDMVLPLYVGTISISLDDPKLEARHRVREDRFDDSIRKKQEDSKKGGKVNTEF